MSERAATRQIQPSRPLLLALGAALVAQFATSLASGVLFLGPMVDTTNVDAVARTTAANVTRAHAGIGLDVVTALVIACLGVLLASALRAQGAVAARVGAALYVVEAALLLVSKVLAYAFVRAVESGAANSMLAPLLGATTFAYALHMLAFCLGALLLYGLLVRSTLLPRWLSWWGLITLIPVTIGTLSALVGVKLPFWLMLPYAPFELVAGLWLVVRAVRHP